ncbi:uncharacterized protein LOC142345714 [Convolutriloba macropyga]|uniref:uncharacterized protein LOC142345714 n=1 Tax=Convolutriloba macropyga TaxID=536237 RepID=UPI003F527120
MTMSEGASSIESGNVSGGGSGVETRMVTFGAFCILLQFCLIPFCVRKCLGQLRPNKMFDITECTMSLIMSSLVSLCSCLSLHRQETTHNSGWFQSGCEILLCYLVAHMMFCIWHEGLSSKIRVWIAHHCVSIIAISILLRRPIDNLQVLNLGSIFMELSNPFTNAVFLLQHIGYSLDNSILFVVLCASWIASFIGSRLIPMPYILYIYVDCYLMDNSVAKCTDRTLFTLPLLLMFLTISTLNLYWFSQMVSGAVSFLFESKSEDGDGKKSRSPLDQYKTD